MEAYNNFIQATSGIFTAYGDIILVDNFKVASTTYPAPYFCPLLFTISAGHTATYTRNFSGEYWDESSVGGYQTLILPFDVVRTYQNVSGIEEERTVGTLCEADYAVWGYVESDPSTGALTFEPATQITTHTPQLIVLRGSRFNQSLDVAFVSANTGIIIPATPDKSLLTDLDANSQFTYTGTFLGTSTSAYYLESDPSGDVFSTNLEPALGERPQSLVPFRAYFQTTGATSLSQLTLADLIACLNDILWRGNGAGTDPSNANPWSVPSNWTNNALPNAGSRITYAPDAIDLHVDGDYTAAAIVNNTTAGLIVLPGQSLVLTGIPDEKIVNFTGSGEITVKAETDTEPNATFLVPKDSVVTANVEFRTKAMSSDVSLTSLMKWQFFGIPVEEFPANRMPGAWIRVFDHTDTTIDEGGTTFYTYWNWLTNSSIMEAVMGYEISVPATHSGLFTFEGTLITEDLPIEVYFESTDTPHTGS